MPMKITKNLACNFAGSKVENKLFKRFLQENTSTERSDIIKSIKIQNFILTKKKNCTSMLIQKFTTEKMGEEKVSQWVHVLDSLILELQTLNIEQKQIVDDITDRIVE